MNDTEMYLQKTAAAITTLQNLHRRNSLRNSSLQNSPISPCSPSQISSPKILSPKNGPSPSSGRPQMKNQDIKNYMMPKPALHKRNGSLDNNEIAARYTNPMSLSLNADNLNQILFDYEKRHTRHNSYEGMSSLPPKPPYLNHQQQQQIDQTPLHIDDDDCVNSREYNKYEVAKRLPKQKDYRDLVEFNTNNNNNNKKSVKPKTSGAANAASKVTQNSPIKRSSSFNTKSLAPQISPMRGTPKMSNKFPQKSQNHIQKSISSTSFKKMFLKQEEFGNDIDYDDDSNDDENIEFFINVDDDLNPNYDCEFSNSDFSDEEPVVNAKVAAEPPISNTRYNKTFLMRVEQSKKAGGGVKGAGVMACPNTPELPRRDLNVARTSFRDRTSMPRDSSLNRMKNVIANATKKNTLTGSNSCPQSAQNKDRQKVLPKYLDISKYKTDKGQTFLKKDETKSYLAREVKKSSSSACLQNAASSSVNFQRDAARTSSRSIKSAGSRPNSSTKKDPGEFFSYKFSFKGSSLN